MWVLAILKAGEHLSSYMITCISLLLVLTVGLGVINVPVLHTVRGTKSPNSQCSISSQLVWFLKLTRCVTNVDALLWAVQHLGLSVKVVCQGHP